MMTTECYPCVSDKKEICADDLPSCSSLLMLTPRLLAANLKASADIIKKTLDGSFNQCCSLCHQKDCCCIPESLCPTPYVATVIWNGCAENTFIHKLQIKNTGKEKRTFTLKPGAFSGTSETVTISPASKVLNPGDEFSASIEFTPPKEMSGGCYTADIVLSALYEQKIKICLSVMPQNACVSVIEQGEMPKKIVAQQWYRHFQCEEDCFDVI